MLPTCHVGVQVIQSHSSIPSPSKHVILVQIKETRQPRLQCKIQEKAGRVAPPRSAVSLRSSFLLRFVVGMRGEAHGSTMVGARRRFLVLLAVRCGFRALSTRAYSSYSRPPAPPAAWRELLLGHMKGSRLLFLTKAETKRHRPAVGNLLAGRVVVTPLAIS